MEKQSYFALGERVSAPFLPATWEQIEAAQNDPETIRVCDLLRVLQQADIPQEERKERQRKLKQLLHAQTVQASHFIGNGKATIKNAVPNGCVLLDIDGQDPDIIWQSIKDSPLWGKRQADAGIIWIRRSVGYNGMHVIARLADGETIEQGQARLAKLFGVTDYDHSTKNLDRKAYLPPVSYTYYLNKEAEKPTVSSPTSEDKQIPEGVSPKGGLVTLATSATLESNPYPTAEHKQIPERGISPHGETGERLPVEHWLRQNGGTPSVGMRNNTLFKMALDFRYITDFNEDWLFRELPHFGLADDEVRSVIHQAVNEERLRGIPKRLLAAMQLPEGNLSHTGEGLGQSITPSHGEAGGKVDLYATLKNRSLPPIPALPRSLTYLLETVPESFRAATLIAMLPALGTVGTSLRFRYLDNQMHSPSFFSALVAPSGTGKSFVRRPLDVILQPIYEQDNIAREQENEYKMARQRWKNSENQPEDPRVAIRCHPLNVTTANLIKHMHNAQGKHLFSFGEEIDTMNKAERVNYSAKKDIFRYAYDNGLFGCSNANENSLNVYEPVFYNILVCGTAGKTFRFFDNIEDGLVARVCFAQLPNMFAADMPVFKDYPESERAYIVGVMRQLMNRNQEWKDAAVREAMTKWNAKTQQWAKLTGSHAIDHYRRRACSMGFRAGMLISVIEDIENSDKSCAARVAEWISDYCFSMFLNLFGDAYEQQAKDDEKRMNGFFSRPLAKKGSPVQVYDELPQEFTKQDLIRLRLQTGQSITKASISVIISRWRKTGKIEDIDSGKFRKLGGKAA